MARLCQHYLDYRRVGFNRLDAMRFAWLVVVGGAEPIPLRLTARR